MGRFWMGFACALDCGGGDVDVGSGAVGGEGAGFSVEEGSPGGEVVMVASEGAEVEALIR